MSDEHVGLLSGTRVVLTRPPMTRDRLAEALRTAGAEVLSVRVVEIVGPDDGGHALVEAVGRLATGHYAWVVFTSQNAVDRLVVSLGEGRALGSAHIACVGKQTASAASRHGLVADLVPGREDAEGLVETFPDPGSPGERVLYPRAADARPVLADGLRAKGWVVDDVVVYRTIAATPPRATVVSVIAASQAIVFASPSALRAYTGMRVGASRAPLPVPAVVACIGPVTASAASDAGIEVNVVAPHPSPEALVEALAGALSGTLET